MLGALLGLGGGVFLVPFLNIVLGLPFKVAGAISLMAVIATSSAVSARTTGQHLINLRLGMLLEVASAAGGLTAGVTLRSFPERLLYGLFSFVTASIAAIMLTRLDRRNVLDASEDPGRLGGRYFDEESQRNVVYKVKPAAARPERLVGGRLRLGGARHRRRHPQGAGAERVVRCADARRGRHQRADDRRHRGRLGADSLRERLHPAVDMPQRRCSASCSARRPVSGSANAPGPAG